jgi:hypothetical protein
LSSPVRRSALASATEPRPAPTRRTIGFRAFAARPRTTRCGTIFTVAASLAVNARRSFGLRTTRSFVSTGAATSFAGVPLPAPPPAPVPDSG